MSRSIKVKNPSGEALDVLVEGNVRSDTSIIFVHGFGTDKHETGGLFDDIAQALNKKFRTIRFDFSGYGQSQGKQEEGNYHQWAVDLNTVLQWSKAEFPGTFDILAQSMGCYVTALLSPPDIHKTILQAPPNADMTVMKRRFIDYFGPRGVTFNESGITLIPRSSGVVQQLGPSFWQALNTFDPVKSFTTLAKNTQLLIIHPQSDEIIGDEALGLYQHLPNSRYLKIPGNHSFSHPPDRDCLVREIVTFFNHPH